MKSCLIATFKDEAAFLLEWVSHHFAVGFDHIIIATNDCTDGTDEMLDLLAQGGSVTHIPNPGPYHLSIQADAYEKARKCAAAQSADWIMCLDADEFLNIHIGDGQVSDLIGSLDADADAIFVNWRLFGDSGHTGFVEAPMTEAFVQAQSAKTKQWPVKTLFRDDPSYLELRPHAPWSHPAKQLVAEKNVFTAAGIRQPRAIFNQVKPFRVTRWAHRSWKIAQVNHYACKTRELFAEKMLKGTAWPNKFSAERLSYEFFDRANQNDEADETILVYRQKRVEIEERLMKNRQLADLHAESRSKLASRIEAMT